MSTRYVEPRRSRHREELVDGVQQLRIPIKRQWFVLAFLPFWLSGWTVGGVAAMKQLSDGFDAFLLFWLGGWVVGWAFAAVTLAAQLGGSEIVRVQGGDLEISRGIGRLRHTWKYRGSMIEHLASYDPDVNQFWGQQRMQMPFIFRPRSGAVKFDYGSETIYVGESIQEPEGRIVVEWLARRLPSSATAI